MKKEILDISPRYIVNEKGQKTEVILDIMTFEKILEELEDLYLGQQAQKVLSEGEFLDFDEVNKKILKK